MRVTYIKTVFLVSRGLFFVVAQKLTATSPADEVHSNYTRYKLLSTIRNYLEYPGSLEVYFIFVLIILKPLKKAQNISLLIHGNVSVLLLL